MKPAEFKQAITLLRDCENKIDFIVHLYDLVDIEEVALQGGKDEKAAAVENTKKTGQQDKPKKTKTWKPKKCIVCGETFQPRSNRQMKCDSCLTYDAIDDVAQDTKRTAEELAAMAK